MTQWNQEEHHSLASAKIDLWLAFCDEITEESLCLAYRDLLNDVEKGQEQRFYFPRDRHCYLITRALVRTVLSRYISIHPREWKFSTNAYGRPDVINAEGKDACISFNISHTRGLVVLGVTKRRALGVDVENLHARAASIDVAERYFAAEEVAALAALPRHQQHYRFYEYWTFKEAYIKARGVGLTLPLDKFSLRYPDNHTVAMEGHSGLADDPARWQFWQFRPTWDHVVAVCAERGGTQSATLSVRQVVPMLCEKEVVTDFLRVSEHRVNDIYDSYNRRVK